MRSALPPAACSTNSTLLALLPRSHPGASSLPHLCIFMDFFLFPRQGQPFPAIPFPRPFLKRQPVVDSANGPELSLNARLVRLSLQFPPTQATRTACPASTNLNSLLPCRYWLPAALSPGKPSSHSSGHRWINQTAGFQPPTSTRPPPSPHMTYSSHLRGAP